jgi:hypothetical protein
MTGKRRKKFSKDRTCAQNFRLLALSCLRGASGIVHKAFSPVALGAAILISCGTLVSCGTLASAQIAGGDTASIPGGQARPAKESADPAPPQTPAAIRVPLSRLPAGTPVIVMTNEDLSTKVSRVGDRFGVTVLHDVTDGATVVIPKGTIGTGEVTFATNNGGFGKPGILGIALRYLELNGAKVLLDGRYREEGANKNGATAATWFAVGVFSGFIRGKPGVIPRGRELKAHTGEDIAYSPTAEPRVSSTEPTSPAPTAVTAPTAAANSKRAQQVPPLVTTI